MFIFVLYPSSDSHLQVYNDQHITYHKVSVRPSIVTDNLYMCALYVMKYDNVRKGN